MAHTKLHGVGATTTLFRTRGRPAMSVPNAGPAQPTEDCGGRAGEAGFGVPSSRAFLEDHRRESLDRSYEELGSRDDPVLATAPPAWRSDGRMGRSRPG